MEPLLANAARASENGTGSRMECLESTEAARFHARFSATIPACPYVPIPIEVSNDGVLGMRLPVGRGCSKTGKMIRRMACVEGTGGGVEGVD